MYNVLLKLTCQLATPSPFCVVILPCISRGDSNSLPVCPQFNMRGKRTSAALRVYPYCMSCILKGTAAS